MAFAAVKLLSFPDTMFFQTQKKILWGIPVWRIPSTFKCSKSHDDGPLLSLNNEAEVVSESREEEKRRFRWVKIGDDIREDQKLAITELPFRMSKRCKAVMEQIICYEPENGSLPELVAYWVKSMKPRRADWLLVLNELGRMDHSVYFKLAELALREESFEACERDYTKLMSCYAKQNRLREAEEIYLAMKGKDFICDQVTLTALVHMYSKAGKLDLAEEAFEEMRLLGVPLDRRSYGSMVMAYIRAGMFNYGESLLKEMAAEENYAGREVYKALLWAYSMTGDSKGAQRIFDSMQVAGIIPDAKMCALLINAYVEAGQSTEAYMAFENLRKSGLQPNDKCISLLLAVYEKHNKLNRALDFLLDLERDGFQLGKEASEILAKWFQRLGVVEEIELVLRDHALQITQ